MPKRIKTQYMPISGTDKLGYLVEECGEVLAAVGKSIRWGINSTNPEIPFEERETNGEWIKRELIDLKRAIKMVEDHLR